MVYGNPSTTTQTNVFMHGKIKLYLYYLLSEQNHRKISVNARYPSHTNRILVSIKTFNLQHNLLYVDCTSARE